MAIPRTQAPRIEDLRAFYVGKTVDDVPKPALILDAALARKHCDDMLQAVKQLGVGFRAHVKTHKTIELARLQAGDGPQDAKFVASTLAEMEHLVPLFQELQAAGRQVNVLYGIPLPPSQIPRLAQLGRFLGSGSLAVMIDHPAQLDAVSSSRALAADANSLGIYLKIDTGYHRAGLPAAGLDKDGLLGRIAELEREGRAKFLGLYSHSSLSYGDTTAAKAMENLAGEIRGCLEGLRMNAEEFVRGTGVRELTISVGASPQVTAVQNLVGRIAPRGALGSKDLQAAAKALLEAMESVDEASNGKLRLKLELHAGVYTVLDMQQLTTRARTFLRGPDEEVALWVAGEVCSVYNAGERARPEALVAVGTLGLGREPCGKAWGIVSRASYETSGARPQRMIVERISQEHSILAWEAGENEGESQQENDLPPLPLKIGQTVAIYPNHACITGAMYNWYLVVDSDRHPKTAKITDVWLRALGW